MNSNKHKFYSIGISHWETPIEIREKYSLTNYEIVNIFNKAKKLKIDNAWTLQEYHYYLISQYLVPHLNSLQEF